MFRPLSLVRTLVPAACLAAALPAAGAAQEGMCGEFNKTPPAGSWTEFRVTGSAGSESTMRFAAIGSEKRDGKSLSRIETTMKQGGESAGGQTMVMQVLVPGYPYEPGDIAEVIVKPNDQPAMRMSGEMMNRLKSQTSPGLSVAERCKSMTLVGNETVTVPGGTFQTRHFRDPKTATDIWLSRDLPFNMVKTKSQNTSLELTRHGTGAKSAIVETPRDMPDPGGRPQ
jgi:hypothetical protein